MKLLILRVVKILIFISFLLSPQIAQADEIESAYKAVERVNSCSAWKAFAKRYGTKDSLFVTLSKEQQKKACVVKPWEKTFGGRKSDEINSIITFPDGEIMVAGFTNSKGKGSYDAWVLRIDLKGNVVWDKTYGLKNADEAYSIIALPDGGAMIAGKTSSKGDLYGDAWVVRIDSKGNVVWEKFFGGKGQEDQVNSITLLADGDAILAGKTEKKGAGDADAWIIRINGEGNLIRDKTFGGSGYDIAKSIVALPDGGAMIAGYTDSKSKGREDVWIIRIDSNENLVWEKTFGGKDVDIANSIIALPDGGAMIAGETSSKGRGKTDAWVIRIDSKGNLVWEKTFGGRGYDIVRSIGALQDGNALLAGYTDTKGSGADDAWVIRIDLKGNAVWDKTYGYKKTDRVHSIIALQNGDAIMAGNTRSKGNGKLDAWIIRMDENGNGPKTTKQGLADFKIQEKRKHNPCAHVYRGKIMKTKGAFGIGLIKWEIVGFSTSTQKVTIRDRAGALGTQEINCIQVPK